MKFLQFKINMYATTFTSTNIFFDLIFPFSTGIHSNNVFTMQLRRRQFYRTVPWELNDKWVDL
jgi:hypothetical protein